MLILDPLGIFRSNISLFHFRSAEQDRYELVFSAELVALIEVQKKKNHMRRAIVYLYMSRKVILFGRLL